MTRPSNEGDHHDRNDRQRSHRSRHAEQSSRTSRSKHKPSLRSSGPKHEPAPAPEPERIVKVAFYARDVLQNVLGRDTGDKTREPQARPQVLEQNPRRLEGEKIDRANRRGEVKPSSRRGGDNGSRHHAQEHDDRKTQTRTRTTDRPPNSSSHRSGDNRTSASDASEHHRKENASRQDGNIPHGTGARVKSDESFHDRQAEPPNSPEPPSQSRNRGRNYERTERKCYKAATASPS